MWLSLLDQALTFIGGVVAASFGVYEGPVTDQGAIAGPYRYTRFVYNGVSASQQYAPTPTGPWTEGFGFGLTGAGFNFWASVYALAHATESWLSSVVFSAGYSVITRSANMPQVMTQGRVVKLIIDMLEFGQPLQISHYLRANAQSQADGKNETHIIDRFVVGGLQGSLAACMGADCNIVGYRVEDRISADPNNGRKHTYKQELAVGSWVPGTGDSVGEADAPQLAACLQWYTDWTGPGERGRSFVPGIAHGMVSSGRLNSGAMDALKAYAGQLLSIYDGDTVAGDWFQLVLWRQHMTGTTLPNDAVSNPITVVGGVKQYLNGKPVYVYPPTNRPPFNPKAAEHPITVYDVGSRLRTQRRRGIDVRIGR